MKIKLNEYFRYIKTIYINEFSKYINEETKMRISELNDVVELNDEFTFKVSVDDKITFNLNLSKYIDENNLRSDSSLYELDQSSKNYIEYLLKYEDDVFEIIKNKLLEQIIILFINNKKNVVSMGTTKIICEKLVDKYNLPYEDIIPSKEKEVALFIMQIVGEDILFNGILNNQIEIVSVSFDTYIEGETFANLVKIWNKLYINYSQKIGKVFLPDSLYEYEKIDYKIKEKADLMKEQKEDTSIIKLKRLASVKRALVNISAHKILFNAHEQVELESNIAEINRITKKIMKNQEKNITGNIDEEYPSIIAIEKDSKRFMSKIWSNFITPLASFSDDIDFNLMVTQDIKDDIIEASIFSSDMLRDIRNVDLGYGFIIEPLEDGVAYASSKRFAYEKQGQESIGTLIDTVNVQNNSYVVDNKEESSLITPNMIINSNLKNKSIDNMLLLNPKRVYPTGIYCFVEDDDLENNSNYLKAMELTDDYNLPVIKINSFDYYIEESKDKAMAH